MDPIKKELLQFIERNQDDMISFLQALIATNSQNPPGDESNVAAIIERKMASLGLVGVKSVALHSNRPNLVYTRQGTSANGLKTIFNSHIDTKPPGDLSQWKTDPYRATIKEGRIHGLGSTDMKGAVAAMVYAFAAVNETGIATPGTIELILSADEEAGSKYGAKFLAEQGLVKGDYLIIGEPCGITEDWESICIVSRGICCFKIKVYGEQMHSSLTDRLNAVNANVKMAQVLAQFQDKLNLKYPDHAYCSGGPTVNPGVVVKGGVYYGVNPGYAEIYCDIRTIPGMTLSQVRSDVEECLRDMQKLDPNLRVELEMAEYPLDWIEPTEIADNSLPVQVIQSACRDVLGKVPPLGAFTGGTDAAYFQVIAGVPTVPAFGPGLLTEAHSPNESLSLNAFIEAAKMYALVAWDLANSMK